MPPWTALAVCPNLQMDTTIEGTQIALTSPHDNRVTDICAANPNFAVFLERFTDAFGMEIWPSVLIADTDLPRITVTVDAIASFRDAVSISVIPQQASRNLVYGRNLGIAFSNTFALYPWMVDRHDEYLIAQTPSMWAIHEVAAFHGQSDPEIPHLTLQQNDIDTPLMQELLERWHEYYVQGESTWNNVALFRSLNMANAAMQMPAGIDTTLYDIGRMLALWVSAFEILAHPRDGDSNFRAVYQLLNKNDWCHGKLAHRLYKAYGSSKKKPRENLACWIYGELYKVRNSFLHGNAVNAADLLYRPSKRSMIQFASPLFRMALSGHLPLRWTAESPPLEEAEAVGVYAAAMMDFHDPQTLCERALRLARIRADNA